MTGLEISGLVDVKVPSKGRTFGLWKAWRRQCCVVRCGAETLQLFLGNSPVSCIDIPHNAVLCRSESRSRMFAFGIFCPSSVSRLRQPIIFLSGRSESESQRWMLRIRNLISRPTIPVGEGEFTVSLIDNCHSRTAGLAGLYGTLSSRSMGVIVSDPTTGQMRAHWRWSQLGAPYLRPSHTSQDLDHLLTLPTTKQFPCGEGELQLFCLSGRELEAALSRHRRLVDSPLPPLPSSPSLDLLAARRLSHSEGDLRCWPSDSNFALFHLRTQSMSQNSTRDKVANGLVTAGLGLMMTTPGCSEPDSLHDYQCLDSHWPEIEEDTLTDLPHFRQQPFTERRRESGVSIASGIYEEIEEQPGEDYEQMKTLQTKEDPPPLPPRRPDLSVLENEPSNSEEPLIYSVPGDDIEEEPLYLPMTPSGQQEDTYVVMANLLSKSHISEPVL